MNLGIRPATPNDFSIYSTLLQKTYQDAYIDVAEGLTKECFSKEVFSSPRIQDYLKSNLIVNDTQKCWLAFEGDKLIGTVGIRKRSDDYELYGFYVATEYQGKGIGKKLWELAKEFAKGSDIVCDTYSRSTKSIDMYKRWGFKIDKEMGEFIREWPEWPKGIKAECLYLRYKNS